MVWRMDLWAIYHRGLLRLDSRCRFPGRSSRSAITLISWPHPSSNNTVGRSWGINWIVQCSTRTHCNFSHHSHQGSLHHQTSICVGWRPTLSQCHLYLWRWVRSWSLVNFWISFCLPFASVTSPSKSPNSFEINPRVLGDLLHYLVTISLYTIKEIADNSCWRSASCRLLFNKLACDFVHRLQLIFFCPNSRMLFTKSAEFGLPWIKTGQSSRENIEHDDKQSMEHHSTISWKINDRSYKSKPR